ncbi:hypothetical protein RhiirA4_426740 [Rhizophagus irregularis]|uniref:Uncharacterized protein n=1 Tax=Rhizophagus irregularis TaxID=588596 RepID=A0A2I1H679_9GLOM|nr:hypothetical protein RhiirA4_426740 [Rhizophagus irregularis]
MALYHVPCLLTFNSLPIDMNVRHFLRSIGDARNFLSFCSLARFSALGSPAIFDWAGIHHCLSQIKGFASYNNSRPEFWIFRIKLLLDMLPTLTMLQQRKPYLYFPDWLCPQCNIAPEDINHLWTCPYILPEPNPCLTHRKETLPDLFCEGFSALDCWNYTTPSASCLWLTRGLLPAHLTDFLKEYFPLSVVYKVISPLLNDFQLELYGEIWLCQNVLFHAWEESQGITASSKSKTKDGLSPNSSIISSHHHNSSLASVSQDFWISWISSSIIRVFNSATSMDQFETTWAVLSLLCTGHCLRVCPASHSTDQRVIRHAHVALLAGLPRGSVAADLSEIAEEISAKSVNIPFSYNSYNSKPYVYSSNDKLRELYNKHLLPSHPAKRHNRFARPTNPQQRSYADAAGQRAPSRSRSRPRSSRSRSQHNKHRHQQRPSQAELEYDMIGMDMPPLMDWQQIVDHITTILEEITHLTTEFSQLQSRVKWLEDQHSPQPRPVSTLFPPPRLPVSEPVDQGWDTNDTADSRRLSDNLMDFSSPVSPQNGHSLLTQSHIPFPSRMRLIPRPATSPEVRFSSLTATVTELTKTVKQGMA